MSTKTTFKRVALVAVAAMGFGVLTSVAPASAAVVAPIGITAGSVGPTRVGVATTVNFAIAHVAGTTSDSFTVAATLTAKPALSTGTVLLVGTGTTSGSTLVRLNRATAGLYANQTVSGASASATVSTGTAALSAGTNTTSYVSVTLTPDVAGDYQILLSTGNGSYTAGDKSAVISISTAGAPATATMTTMASTIATAGTYGSPIKVVLKDANGVVTKPNSTESINLTVTSGSATLGGVATVAIAGTSFASGAAITMIKDAVAEDTVVVTSSGGGTLASTTTLASTLAMTSSKTSATAAATAAVWQQGTGVATTGFKLASTTSLIFPSTATSQSIGIKTLTANGLTTDTTSTTLYTTVTVTDTDGAIGNGAGTAYDVVISQAGIGATKTSALSVTATLGTTYQYQVSTTLGGIVGALVVTGATPAATTTGAISPAVVNSALLGVNTFISKTVDQFGSAIANASVVATVSAGRNSTKAAVNMLTDASGYVSYTLTDSGTNGTSDTVTFTGATTVNASVNYGLATVKTATLTGGNTTAGVTSPTNTTYDITAGDGAEGGVQSFTVTVKDANGALLSGLPVTWSVSGTTVAITSNTKTGYTAAAGTNSAKVYAWVAGTYTVTATVGGIAATGTITFGQTGAGEERAISAKAAGPVVTATVVDRFGNPVPGVTVYATKTGVGYFGSGTTKTSGTTDTLGTVDFVITGGSADVKVSTLSYSATAGTCPSGQTGALKGNADCTADPADATAFTAAAAGTAVKAEVGVGVSFADAGVSSATASVTADTSAVDNAQAASDAAAEATDAANAATDAANAAAEAADAATAAAQDAADAVAALSVQVSEQIAALRAQNDSLRKQLIALTNLIIKIQKKVKA
jgi:hypothetical protein